MMVILALLAAAVAVVFLFTFALCHAASEGDRLADELYAQWLEENGHGRAESEAETTL